MNISQLEILVAVVAHGTFSDAAMHLDISQSAVSRAIAALESELGVSLLVRGRFGAKLTPVGARVLDPVHKMLDLKDHIEAEVNLAKGLYNSRLRIASFRSAATHLLPANIARYCQHFPHVEVSLVELDPAGVEQSLRLGQTDVGLLPLPRTEEFQTWEMAQDEYIVLLPRGETTPPPKLSWTYLSAYSFILLNYAECTDAVKDHWAQWQQSYEVAYGIKEDSTIVSMVAQGLGAAVLPKLAALPIPNGVHVRSLPVRLKRHIGVAILANSRPTPAVQMFLDLLRGEGQFAT
ncbi:MAG: LysR family transcriptional regulator [Cyanobacteria bacterium P01_A01_bin.105]